MNNYDKKHWELIKNMFEEVVLCHFSGACTLPPSGIASAALDTKFITVLDIKITFYPLFLKSLLPIPQVLILR